MTVTLRTHRKITFFMVNSSVFFEEKKTEYIPKFAVVSQIYRKLTAISKTSCQKKKTVFSKLFLIAYVLAISKSSFSQ